MLIGAGLFGRTLLRLYSLETGFHREDVFLIAVKTDRAQAGGHALRGRNLGSFRLIPGGFDMAPIIYGAGKRARAWKGTPMDDLVHLSFIAEDSFRTLRTPVIKGREFSERVTATTPKSVVDNEAFVRRYFQGQSPLGKLFA